MSRFTPRFKTDPGLLVALWLATFAAWPFLTRAGLPTFTDAEQHVYRVYEVMEAWKAGVIYPRWAPDLFYAYGYPVFHYYAPLTYHLAAAYGFLFGGPLAGMKFVLVSAAYLGGAGMYLFVRDRWGSLAGMVAAASFVLAPYVVYVDPHARGAAPETFAIGLAPVMLWAFARLRSSRTASPWDMIFAAFMLAALTLSHNLMSFVFLGLLVAWLAWDVVLGTASGASTLSGAERSRRALAERGHITFPAESARWKVLLALGAAILLGLGLSAFMWLPAILERGAVQFHNAAGGAGTYFDFHKYFIRWRELFAPSLIFDLGATQMRFNHNLGPPQWGLAALGALSIFSLSQEHPERSAAQPALSEAEGSQDAGLGDPAAFARRVRRRDTLFFSLAALGLIFLMTRTSVRLWETFPPIAFLQFPTRLLGPAAAMLGILAGASVSWADALRLRLSPSHRAPDVIAARTTDNLREGGPLALLFSAAAVAVCIAAATPLLYPPPWSDFGPMNSQRIIKTERDGRGVGTTSGNEFLPVGVTIVPGPRESLWESYLTGMVDKINRQTLPEGTTVTAVEHGPEHDRFRVRGSTRFVLRLYTFYWPGWTAYVDGVKTPIEVAEPDGWITFWIPEGAHDVLLRLENTPPRWLGWGVSGLALLGLLGLALWGLRWRAPTPIGQVANLSNRRMLAWPHALALGAVVLMAMAVRLAADRAGWWWVRSTGSDVLVAQYQQFTRLEDDVALLGFDLPVTSARPGDLVPVTLYWKAMAPLQHNLRVFVHFLGPDGNLWGQSDKWNPADFPMNGWPLDLYVRDEHDAPLQPDAPPGVYTVRAGLYDENGVRMHVLDANGVVTDADGVVLTTEFVMRP